MVQKISLKFKNFQPHIMAELIPWKRGKNLPHEQVFEKNMRKVSVHQHFENSLKTWPEWLKMK